MGDNEYLYMPRFADGELSQRLARSGAVVIRGPKWCGKTETARQQAKSVLYMQNPDTYQSNMLLAVTKPSVLLRGDKPRLIDEWQVAPALWDAVRFDVDMTRARGGYILTGSATPGEKPLHSGAGRFSIMDMRTMTLFEQGLSSGEVSLAALMDGGEPDGSTAMDVEDYARAVCRGGWPEVAVRGEDGQGLARDYLAAVADEDISSVDGVQRSADYAMLAMRAYARCTSTQADMAKVRADIIAHGDDMSRNTLSAYVNALRSLYVLEDLEAWKPSLRDKTRVTSTPTRHFTDPSLAAAALGATPESLLADMPTLGALFESLCVHDLRIYARACGGSLYHYRDDGGRESDAVVVFPDGRWALVEVKLGARNVDQGAKGLLDLASKIDQGIVGPPAFLAVVSTGPYAYRRPDGVLEIPLACLTK